jgi:hypothetical protein
VKQRDGGARERPPLQHSFIVRIAERTGGRLSGTVERVRTGEKARFETLEGVAAAIRQMLRDSQEVSNGGPA